MSTSLPSRVFCPCSSKAAFLHSPTSRGTGENAKEAGLGVRTHSSTANSSSVSTVSHCLALVRFSCVMLERLPRSLPSATIELVDHRQGCAQHLVLENSFRLGRAGAAPRQWRRNRGLLYPAHLDMVTEDKATITLEKYIGRRCVATTGARSTAGRPSAAQRPGFILSSCGCCCCMRTARRHAPSLL